MFKVFSKIEFNHYKNGHCPKFCVNVNRIQL